jgi:hypothetical protein
MSTVPWKVALAEVSKKNAAPAAVEMAVDALATGKVTVTEPVTAPEVPRVKDP